MISELESHSFVQNNMCGSHQSPVGATGTSVVRVGRWCEYPLNVSQVGMTSGNDIDTRLVSMYVSMGQLAIRHVELGSLRKASFGNGTMSRVRD